MSRRTAYTLGKLYEVHNGLSKASKFFGSGYPFITFKDVFNNYFIPEVPSGLVQSTQKEQDSYSVKRGDILITRTSETHDELGMSSVALIDYPHTTYNGFTKRLRPITDLVHPEFIGYYLRAPFFRSGFQQFSSMTTRASLKNEELLNMRVLLPSMEEQKRLASFLMAYDNLIENNRRQIALLEEAAQRLYREWFVDLRFPGHEGVEIVDELPDGWLRMPISEYAHVIKGCSYKTENIDVEQGVPMVNLASIASWGGYKPYTERTYGGAYKAEQVLGANDVVMALTEQTAGLAGYVARIPRYAQGSIPSMDLACLRPKSGTCAYLYCTCRFGDVSRLLSPLANGTKIKHLKPEALGYTDMPVPPMELQQKFEDTVNPTFGCIDVLMEQNERLRVARDHLLPKLMSGEIEVEG